MRSKYLYLGLGILISIVFIFISCGKDEQKGEIEILINPRNNNIKINNKIIQSFDLNGIEKLIGKPNRIEIDTTLSRYEEHGYGEYPSTSTMIEIVNYYYIYDKLGLMFYTNNGRGIIKEPEKLSVHFKNKRLFTNTSLPPFFPNNSFSGILKINNEILNADEGVIPEGVNYNTKDFQLFSLSFGPTSIGAVIDRLYSMDVEPYILLYLDSEERQRISYVEILNTQ